MGLKSSPSPSTWGKYHFSAGLSPVSLSLALSEHVLQATGGGRTPGFTWLPLCIVWSTVCSWRAIALHPGSGRSNLGCVVKAAPVITADRRVGFSAVTLLSSAEC